MKNWITFSYFVLQLPHGRLLEIDVMKDEALLCAVLEGLDHTDGERCICLGQSEVGGDIRDAVGRHGSRC